MSENTIDTSAAVAEVAETACEATASAAEETNVTPEATAPAWQGADTADKLSYAAAVVGVSEDRLVEALLHHSGDDGARWGEHLDARQREAEQHLTDRLAAEFQVLAAEVPSIRHVDDLPDEVLNTALTEGVTLFDAYLRQWYAVWRETAAQEASARAAAEQSAGALGGAFDEPDPKETAFSRSFRGALS